ncbi:transcription antitermination protein nusG [Actinobacteria bacterium IMCC26207]|nr:transcription antitermination protein nusG [Actinobacteria bacterium IMCC26207]
MRPAEADSADHGESERMTDDDGASVTDSEQEIVEELIEEEIVEEIVEELIEEAIVEEIVEELIEEAIVEEIVAEEVAEVLAEEELLAQAAAAAAEAAISPYDKPGKWYVLHTQSGYENKVRQNIEARTRSMAMDAKIHEVAIPMEEVTEFKAGKKVIAQKKMFPGYLIIRCSLDDDSWYVIRNTPGVTGFVGAGNKPSPLSRREVEEFIRTADSPTDDSPKRARPRLEYELNETVRVKEGPFADFSGSVVDIDEDHMKMKVLVNIFGRETPVELEFSQVAKL